MTEHLPEFRLRDAASKTYSFPSARLALLCFVNEDCPTCNLSMPLIEAAHHAFGTQVDVWAIGQEAAGNAALVERHGLTLPMLDDSELRVSFRYNIETMPTLVLADGSGKEAHRMVG